MFGPLCIFVSPQLCICVHNCVHTLLCVHNCTCTFLCGDFCLVWVCIQTSSRSLKNGNLRLIHSSLFYEPPPNPPWIPGENPKSTLSSKVIEWVPEGISYCDFPNSPGALNPAQERTRDSGPLMPPPAPHSGKARRPQNPALKLRGRKGH